MVECEEGASLWKSRGAKERRTGGRLAGGGIPFVLVRAHRSPPAVHPSTSPMAWHHHVSAREAKKRLLCVGRRGGNGERQDIAEGK